MSLLNLVGAAPQSGLVSPDPERVIAARGTLLKTATARQRNLFFIADLREIAMGLRKTIAAGVAGLALVVSACGGGGSTAEDTTEDAATGSTATTAQTTTSTSQETTTIQSTTTTVASTTTAFVRRPRIQELVAVRYVLSDDPTTDHSAMTDLNLYRDFLQNLVVPDVIEYSDPAEAVRNAALPVTVLIELPAGTVFESGALSFDAAAPLPDNFFDPMEDVEELAADVVVSVGDTEATMTLPYSTILRIVTHSEGDQQQEVLWFLELFEPAAEELVAVLGS